MSEIRIFKSYAGWEPADLYWEKTKPCYIVQDTTDSSNNYVTDDVSTIPANLMISDIGTSEIKIPQEKESESVGLGSTTADIVSEPLDDGEISDLINAFAHEAWITMGKPGNYSKRMESLEISKARLVYNPFNRLKRETTACFVVKVPGLNPGPYRWVRILASNIPQGLMRFYGSNTEIMPCTWEYRLNQDYNGSRQLTVLHGPLGNEDIDDLLTGFAKELHKLRDLVDQKVAS
jgi:hypothetical protein